jgi:xanthine dehydrogenase accessory factor
VAEVDEIYRRISDLNEAGREFAAATVVAVKGSSPRAIGTKMLVLPDGSSEGSIGGGKIEKTLIGDAIDALSAGESVLRHYNLKPEHEEGIGMFCGGEMDIFIEVHKAPRTLVVFGAGHVGQALARAAFEIGMPVTVVDGRKEFADPARFPSGTRVLHADPAGDEAAALVNEKTYAVTVTHSHELDMEVLRSLVRRPAPYVGMIGSKRKVRTIMDRLKDDGFTREELARVFAPIGLDIGAETPAEIAVSILAEVINHYRKGGASPGSMKEKAGD